MKYILTLFTVMVVLTAGALSTLFIWKRTVRDLSGEAMEQALIVAQSIDQKRLANLKGNTGDLNSRDYLRIKEQLTRIRLANRKCRFLYLMGRRKDDTVFFYLDAQPPDSSDYAPPGLIYKEVSEEYLQVFDTGGRRTVGPITDRWGTLITSLVPIYSDETKELIAILGMDIDARDWRREVLSKSLVPVSMTISIILLIVILVLINRNRRMMQLSLQHVKKLQGLLPICSSCKKIKDDKGYWKQIEAYLHDNAEVEFSHGLCEECMEKIYGQESWYDKDKMEADGES